MHSGPFAAIKKYILNFKCTWLSMSLHHLCLINTRIPIPQPMGCFHNSRWIKMLKYENLNWVLRI